MNLFSGAGRRRGNSSSFTSCLFLDWIQPVLRLLFETLRVPQSQQLLLSPLRLWHEGIWYSSLRFFVPCYCLEFFFCRFVNDINYEVLFNCVYLFQELRHFIWLLLILSWFQNVSPSSMVVPTGGRRTAAGQSGAVTSATHLRGIPAPSPIPATGSVPQHNHSLLQGQPGEIQPPLIICILLAKYVYV